MPKHDEMREYQQRIGPALAKRAEAVLRSILVATKVAEMPGGRHG